MNLDITEDQELLPRSVRKFAEAELQPQRLAALELSTEFTSSACGQKPVCPVPHFGTSLYAW
jgi:hypothetical protein